MSNSFDSNTENIQIKGKGKAAKITKIRSCDFCRNNKVRCDRLPNQCSNCSKRGIECTRNNPYQKRGPKPKKSGDTQHIDMGRMNANLNSNNIIAGNYNSYCDNYYNMFNINLEPISSPNSFDLTSGTIGSPTLSSNILNQLNENDIRNLNYFFTNVNNNLNLINQSYLINQLTLNQHEFHLIHMLTLMIKVTKWHNNIEQSEANAIIYQFKNMIDWMSIYSVNNTDPNLNIILPAINTLNELLKFIHWRYQIQIY